MKEILEIIIKGLVSNPNDVEVSYIENSNPNIVNLSVACNKDDMGKIIGKSGKMARNIRTLMQSIAQNQKKKVIIEFKD